jgi:hypothetical protein
MTGDEKIWYGKLLAKLKKIELGDMQLSDYISEIEGKIEEKIEVKHQLEYSMYSCRVSWCPICHKHFYNEKNKKHTTVATNEHFHIL